MAKISNVVAYPEITPTLDDYVVITDQDTKDLETKTCTLADARPVITTTNNNTYISRVKLGLSQLQVLRCSPVLMVPRPGPNKVIKPETLVLYVKPGSQPFTNATDYWGIWGGQDPQCSAYTSSIPPYTIPASCTDPNTLRGGQCWPTTNPPTYIYAPEWGTPGDGTWAMDCCGERWMGILGVGQLQTTTPAFHYKAFVNDTLPINYGVYVWNSNFYSTGTPINGSDSFFYASIKYKIIDLDLIK